MVAKGRGLIAEEIISRAHEHGVFVHESPEPVALLSRVDIDGQIPPELYIAIAELLAWIYQVEREGVLPMALWGEISGASLTLNCFRATIYQSMSGTQAYPPASQEAPTPVVPPTPRKIWRRNCC